MFGTDYAKLYDAVYAQKDYAGECDTLEQLFLQYGAGPVRSVLDLGCGTGTHALCLAERGYEVVGVDSSAPMVELARSKASLADLAGTARFDVGDLKSVDLGRSFDAALMMFAVLGYQTSDSDVQTALANARRHLDRDGLLVFDVWYGAAVEHQGPSDRVRTIVVAGDEIKRTASGELDLPQHLCHVRIRLERFDGSEHSGTTEEAHDVRYFFVPELETFLDSAGFELVRLGAFPDVSQEPDDKTWSVLGVARAL